MAGSRACPRGRSSRSSSTNRAKWTPRRARRSRAPTRSRRRRPSTPSSCFDAPSAPSRTGATIVSDAGTASRPACFTSSELEREVEDLRRAPRTRARGRGPARPRGSRRGPSARRATSSSSRGRSTPCRRTSSRPCRPSRAPPCMPNGQDLVLELALARGSKTLPFQASRWSSFAAGQARSVPGRTSTVPCASPLGIGPASLERKSWSSSSADKPQQVAVLRRTSPLLLGSDAGERSTLTPPGKECLHSSDVCGNVPKGLP